MQDIETLRSQLASEPNPARRLDLIDEILRPLEPQLLDTSVVQNLDWLYRQFKPQGSWERDEASVSEMTRRFGEEMTNDLVALDVMQQKFEYDSGYPWLVCETALQEASLLKGPKGESIRQQLEHLSGLQDDWSNGTYPGIAPGLLFDARRGRVSPLILKALSVESPDQVYGSTGPLSFLPDAGDRLVAAHALFSNIPVILTTDRKTFWSHRGQLEKLGVTVFRPGELLNLYEPYWDALSEESARRSKR